MELIKKAAAEFVNIFGEDPVCYGCAPGRVEVLGNHTDYNEGFVLAAAIDRHTVLCGRKVEGVMAKVYACTLRQGATFQVDNPELSRENFWLGYLQGVVDALARRGIRVGGFEALIMSDVPLGAGLSSSAALEVATAMFLQQLYPFLMERLELARACQAAENDFVGVNCGLLDQFSSIMGEDGQLIFMDFREPEKSRCIPLGNDVELVLANTNAAHDLAEGTYNRLREDCFAAAKILAGKCGHPVTHLRDVSLDDFNEHGRGMDPEIMKRARHVVTENARVLRSVNALDRGDLQVLGECMFQSHASSRDDFGNSCAELDAMVQCAKTLDGCYGARLSGGGFGGCTVNLVAADKAEAFARELGRGYREKTGIAPEMHICKAVGGACGGRLE